MTRSSDSLLSRHSRCLPLLLVALVFICPTAARGQGGSTTDILTGVVRGPDGQPIQGATVVATSFQNQLQREARTNARGRYTIVFPDGGGQYRLDVRFIGLAPAQLILMRQADEDELVADVTLSNASVALEPVTVTARRARPESGTQPTPGEAGRNLNPEAVARLPLDASDLNVVATLVPGVLGLAGTDSTESAFSVAGLRPTANAVTLDGLTYGSGSVPQDAVQNTRVVTSTYDVARGEFSGGLVASTTRSGTNTPAGSFTYTLRDRNLAWGGPAASAFEQGYTQQQLGGGFGGPLVRNKLFAFGSLQGRWRTQALPSLLSADPATLSRLGLAGDSLSNFLQTLGSLGVPMNAPVVPANRVNTLDGAVLRIDWMMANAQTLMLRGDWRLNDQYPASVGSLALPQNGGNRTGWGGGIMATLTSYFGGTHINELRTYFSVNRTGATPYLLGPDGRVQIASTVADSSLAITTVSFGGNAGMPQQSNQTGFEGTDELSWLLGGAAHRVKLGLFLRLTGLDNTTVPNEYGTFLFNSLPALAVDSPSVFTRTLAAAPRMGTATEAALYLGDSWRRRGGLQLTYGVRAEGSEFSGAPPLNRAVDSLFGVRTDAIPSEIHVSPRIGFTWLIGSGGRGGAGRGGAFGGGGGASHTIVRGGVGEFRSPTPTSLYSSALAASGLASGETQIYCVGSGVPTPDWSEYFGDPSGIPTSCSDSADDQPAVPNLVVFAPTYGASRTWRGSFGIQQRVSTYVLSWDANYTRGINQYGFTDLNLGPEQFSLAGEGNRPVFAPAATIVPGTGAIPLAASRLYPDFGQVLEIGSGLGSEAVQSTISIGGSTSRGAVLQLAYTYTRARDQSSFSSGAAAQGFAAPTTGGNPNDVPWATSDFERRHSILATITYPISGSLEITTIGRLNSGTPYTPIVGSDINGDGARNDRAFIFDPAATADTLVANGMRRLLAGGSSSAQQCLMAQIGTIAGRNSCTGPWTPSLDFQINWRPRALGLNRRLTLSLLTVNLLSGVDQLLHGPNDLQGWGQGETPNPVLLTVRGFDPASGAFLYQVNGRFGAASSATAIRVPFQIGIQGHLTVGPDATRQRLNTMFGAGGGGGGRGGFGRGGGEGGGITGDAFLARFARALPNPVRDIMGESDTLGLTPDQVTRLTGIADSLDAANRTIADSVQAAIEKAGPNPDPAVLFAAIRPRIAKGRDNIRAALGQAREVLTKAQWDKLPDRIRQGAVRERRPAQ